MRLNDLITTAMARVDDKAEGKLWERREWIEYANDAQNEACRRSRLLVDSTTAAVCNIDLELATETYELHDSIMFIRRARLLDADGVALSILGRRHAQDMDRCGPGWPEEVGRPSHYIPDIDDHLFRPYPMTDEEGLTVQLTVVRTPLIPANKPYAMNEGDDVPEIRQRWHLGLVNWMMVRAYNKQDSQCYNPKAAAFFEGEFVKEFGKKSSAIDEAWLAREADYTEAEGNF